MSRSLVFLARVYQVDMLHENNAGLLNDSQIISLDLDVSARLDELGYRFQELTEIVPIDKIGLLSLEAERLCRSWFKPWEALTVHDSYSPLRADRSTMHMAFTEALIAKELFQRMVDHNPPSQLMLFENHGQPDKVWNGPKPDVINAVWRYMAETYPITIVIIPDTKKKPNPFNSIYIRDRLQRMYHMLDLSFSWVIDSLVRYLLLSWKHSSNIGILFAVSPEEARRYSTILHQLKAHFGRSLLATTTTPFHRVNTELPDSRVVWHPLPTLLPFDKFLFFKRKMKKVYDAWKEDQQQYSGAYPEIFANPYLDFQFHYILNERMPLLLQAYRWAKAALQAIKPKIVVTTGFSFYYQAELMEAARSLDMHIVTVPHSGLPTSQHQTFFGDKAIVWDHNFLYVWNTSPDPERFIVTGLPPSIAYSGRSQPSVDIITARQEKIVLVLMSPISEGVLHFVDMARHRNMLVTLTDIPSHLKSKVRVIFKLHPGAEHVDFYRYILQQSTSPDAVELIRYGDPVELVRQSDLVVLASMPTSVYLTPLIEKKPLIYMRAGDMPLMPFFFAQKGGAAALRDDSVIWPIIEKTLFTEQGYAEILSANAQLWRSMVPHDEDPIELMRRIFQQMLGEAS